MRDSRVKGPHPRVTFSLAKLLHHKTEHIRDSKKCERDVAQWSSLTGVAALLADF